MSFLLLHSHSGAFIVVLLHSAFLSVSLSLSLCVCVCVLSFDIAISLVISLLVWNCNKQYKNLAIDFGAVAAFAVAAKLDFDKQLELSKKVEDKVAAKKEEKKIAKVMGEREKQLSELMVEIQVRLHALY